MDTKKKGSKKTPIQKMGKAVPDTQQAEWQKLRRQPPVAVGWVTARLGLSSGRPKQLTDQGIITRRPGGKVGPEAILEYVCWLRSRAEARDQSNRGLIEAEKLRALKRENDLAESRLFTAEVLQDALAKIVDAWVRILDEVPARWKRKFPETTGDQLEAVTRFIADMRNELADAAVDTMKNQGDC